MHSLSFFGKIFHLDIERLLFALTLAGVRASVFATAASLERKSWPAIKMICRPHRHCICARRQVAHNIMYTHKYKRRAPSSSVCVYFNIAAAAERLRKYSNVLLSGDVQVAFLSSSYIAFRSIWRDGFGGRRLPDCRQDTPPRTLSLSPIVLALPARRPACNEMPLN